jgi:hypothetical protein
MAKGGKQPGAGRPKGSVTKPRFADYVSAEDRAAFVEFILSTYMADMRLATWVGDQLFGKAPQGIDVTSGGSALTILFDPAFKDEKDDQPIQ